MHELESQDASHVHTAPLRDLPCLKLTSHCISALPRRALSNQRQMLNGERNRCSNLQQVAQLLLF